MATGRAVCIGLNGVDPDRYNGWGGPLNACEADAQSMSDIAKASGFASVETILTKSATRDAVLSRLEDAAERSEPGDLFMLTVSSHGGQLPDLNGDEDDGLDETWCLYDGELVDDETYTALGKFKSGVRILLFVDACHSGTSARELLKQQFYSSQFHVSTRVGDAVEDTQRFKAMPSAVASSTYAAMKDFYYPILTNSALDAAKQKLETSVFLFSACQDNQLSRDGPFNGAFTGHLLTVWNGGKFKGTYRQFAKKLQANMKPDQTPKFTPYGPTIDGFLDEIPFSV
ncbi:caspase family protein [Caballeronia sp. INSB1]|uniref:caspase family protein n=1 Tax=Caballeronia sp. INSB1 TaxID=2921751 RepID=UPI0020331694|nr:caspase family protein [Caballeronia sp. INSB1]